MNNSISQTRHRTWSDYLGIASSSICFVHCILPPLLMLFNIGLTETPEFNYLFLFISFIAVFNTTRYHPHKGVVGWLWAAFCLTSLGVLFEDDLPVLEYLIYLSTLALIGGHIWNIWYARKCMACKK
jgi:hypothetical protein